MSTAPIGRMQSFTDTIEFELKEKEKSESEKIFKTDFKPEKMHKPQFVYAFDYKESIFVVGEVIDMVFNSECCVYHIRTINRKAEKRDFWTYRILKRLPPIR